MSAAEATPQIVTFGCRLNLQESAVIEAQARRAGLSDAVIVNTCAVTKEAERQARQTIRRLKREQPDRPVIVTGCAAQITPEAFAAMEEVSAVVGNDDKLRAAPWRQLAQEPHPADPMILTDIRDITETAGHLIAGQDIRSRAYLQIQNGCDHRCTFCVIPHGRGPARSVPIGAMVAQARALVDAGHQELVLTGVDLTSYGPDLPGRPTLGQAVRRLLAQLPELPRLRLSSLDPAEIDEDLWHLIATEPRLCPHLHLSLQAGHDLILKRMKRRHLMADVAAVVTRARALRPDMLFGADLIAGFPTETDAHAAATRQAIEDLDIALLHVFPYSPRPGTPAARIPQQVPEAERKTRAAALRAVGDRLTQAAMTARLGRPLQVLIEKDGRQGRAAEYLPVRLAEDQPDLPPGRLADLVPVAVGDGVLLARAHQALDRPLAHVACPSAICDFTQLTPVRRDS